MSIETWRWKRRQAEHIRNIIRDRGFQVDLFQREIEDQAAHREKVRERYAALSDALAKPVDGVQGKQAYETRKAAEAAHKQAEKELHDIEAQLSQLRDSIAKFEQDIRIARRQLAALAEHVPTKA